MTLISIYGRDLHAGVSRGFYLALLESVVPPLVFDVTAPRVVTELQQVRWSTILRSLRSNRTSTGVRVDESNARRQ